MELKTQRLKIRFIEEKDWKSLIAIWDDFNRSRYVKYDVPHTTSESEVREKAKRWATVSPQKEHMFFAVCIGDEMIGYIDFHQNQNGYECGYCFHSKFHGKGYAKESMQALMEWISKKGKTRFIAGTALNNLPSVKLLESLGFVKINEEQVSFYKDDHNDNIFFTGGIFAFETKG